MRVLRLEAIAMYILALFVYQDMISLPVATVFAIYIIALWLINPQPATKSYVDT